MIRNQLSGIGSVSYSDASISAREVVAGDGRDMPSGGRRRMEMLSLLLLLMSSPGDITIHETLTDAAAVDCTNGSIVGVGPISKVMPWMMTNSTWEDCTCPNLSLLLGCPNLELPRSFPTLNAADSALHTLPAIITTRSTMIPIGCRWMLWRLNRGGTAAYLPVLAEAGMIRVAVVATKTKMILIGTREALILILATSPCAQSASSVMYCMEGHRLRDVVPMMYGQVSQPEGLVYASSILLLMIGHRPGVSSIHLLFSLHSD
mmetsp:Transcript_21695/g.44743  ORF Transcript_21695/g.44743 Transcript_21695/m.44743 type:complete len:262 (+) Transcript_21695:384-1169(+)